MVLLLHGTANDPLVVDVKKIIVEINRLNRKTSNNQTLLHLCFDNDTNVFQLSRADLHR